jgi:hypothetical protein
MVPNKKKSRKNTRRQLPSGNMNPRTSDPGELESIRLTGSATTLSYNK